MSEPTPQRQARSALGIGLPTMLTAMVVVLLTTFSVLALLSARSDLNLTDKAVSSMEDYYAADTEAERWLATLDATVAGSWDEATPGALTAAGFTYVLETEGDGCLVSKTFSLGENRQLTVQVAVSGQGQLTVLQWQSAPLDAGQ